MGAEAPPRRPHDRADDVVGSGARRAGSHFPGDGGRVTLSGAAPGAPARRLLLPHPGPRPGRAHAGPQPAGQGPLRRLLRRPRRRPGRQRPGPPAGGRLGAPLLPRPGGDARPRLHRPGGDAAVPLPRRRPLQRGAPDAGPLEQPAPEGAQRVVPRGRRSCCTPPGSPWPASSRGSPTSAPSTSARAPPPGGTSTRPSTSPRSTASRCVFVCENNGYAISQPQRTEMPLENVADRALAYDMPGQVVDGNDVLAVYEAMRGAVDRARQGEGPTLLEAKTYRLVPHTSDDDDTRLPLPGGGRRLEGARPARPLPRHPPRSRGADAGGRARSSPGVSPARWTRPPTSPSAPPSPIPPPCTATSTPSLPPWTVGAAASRLREPADDRAEPPRSRPQRAPRGHGARPPRPGAGRRRRPQGGRLRRHQGPLRRLRGRARDRRPARRVGHRRRRHRGGRQRPPAGGGDPVRRLHLPRHEPDRERGGAPALPLQRGVGLPHRHPRPLRRGHPRGPLPLPERGGLLRPRPRTEGGRPRHPGRRQGAPGLRHRRPRPGALLRAQGGLPGHARGRPGRGAPRPHRPRPRRPRRGATSPSSPTA